MVIDKSWNMENWHDQSQNLPIFSTNLIKFVLFFADIKKFSIDSETLHFQTFSAKCCE